MAVEIEGLEFQIEAKSENAAKGVDALINSFNKLKAATKGGAGLNNISKKLDAISNGSVAWGAHDGNGYNVASGDGQFPLFMFDRTKLHNREDYWLRDVSSATYFSFVDGAGNAGRNDASFSFGVRPAFCIG